MRALAWAMVVGGLAAGSAAGGSAQSAREATPSERWSLNTLRSGFCVHFLADPAQAGRGIWRGAALISAAADDSLHPALRRVLKDSPEFGAWIPSQLCFYQFASIDVGGKKFVDNKHGRSQSIVVWSMPVAGRDRIPVVLLTNNSHVSSTVNRFGIRVDGMSSAFGKVPESTDDRYTIKFGKTLLTWDGHPTGDSTAAPAVDRTWTTPGRNGKVYRVHEEIQPASARLLVGALSVQGKGDLARLLTASPIRYVGPLLWGGSGQISFVP